MIDVTVVDYGTPQLAARCVGSLTSEHFTSIELVDAKSRALSYAQSVNRSLARGSAPYVLALNADTRMLEAPEKILAIFEEHSDVAVVGPRQVDDHGRITHAGITGDNLARQHRFWLSPLEPVERLCKEWMLDVPTVSGSVYFCRRSVWEALGGFLETRGYYEETYLDFAARHAGHRVIYTGASTWEHLWHRGGMAALDSEGVFAESREVFHAACARKGITCAN